MGEEGRGCGGNGDPPPQSETLINNKWHDISVLAWYLCKKQKTSIESEHKVLK